MSVYRAARSYNVPEQTLRDRVRGNVAVDAKIGCATIIFTLQEEKALVDHLVYMGKIGYGYTKTNIQFIAKDYADALGKNLRSEHASGQLSNNWFYGFLGRWEDQIKLVKPQKLSVSRAKSASPQNLSNYFKELSTVMTNNNLHNKPARIFNIDETGVTTSHDPPKVVCDKDSKPQAITSERSATVTIIAGGNAMGNFIPPYYIFPGKRWNPEFMTGAAPGSAGEMSETGWSNMKVFHNYIKTHFANHAGITNEKNQEPTLVLYDGHRSHISLTLADWAKKRNVIPFVLPPHSSHLTQPLDVGVFGPFKNMYNRECATFMQKHPGLCITKYDIVSLTCSPYLKSLSPQNLISAFRKTGICPFDNKAILPDETAPSAIYVVDDSTAPGTNNTTPTEEPETAHIPDQDDGPQTSAEGTQNETTEITEEPVTLNLDNCTPEPSQSTFFESRTIRQAIVKKPKRKFVPPYIAGNLIKSTNMNVLQAKGKAPTKKPKLDPPPKKVTAKTGKSTKGTKQVKTRCDPCPSTSGLGKKGGPLPLSEDTTDNDSDVDYTDDEETCCVCDKWQPKDLEKLAGIVFVKWGKCDFCSHWTHLNFCTPVKVLRRGSVFRCPHCVEK